MIALRTDKREQKARVAEAMRLAEKQGKLGWQVVLLLAPREPSRSFPVDMLRYSNGRPASEVQSNRIERSITAGATGAWCDENYDPEAVAIRFYGPTLGDLRGWCEQMAERLSSKFGWEVLCGLGGHEINETPARLGRRIK